MPIPPEQRSPAASSSCRRSADLSLSLFGLSGQLSACVRRDGLAKKEPPVVSGVWGMGKRPGAHRMSTLCGCRFSYAVSSGNYLNV